MDRHAGFKSFRVHAEIQWMASEDENSIQRRELAYVRPNLFKIVGRRPELMQVTVCDGRKLLEYSDNDAVPPTLYPAPRGVWERAGMQMMHPMFCGSLLYQFFGGPQNLKNLADTGKSPIKIVDETQLGDEKAKILSFYGAGPYGHVRVTVGETTGLVHRIVFDAEPLMEMMNDPAHRKRIRAAMEDQLANMPHGEKRDEFEKSIARFDDSASAPKLEDHTETYHDFVVDAEIPILEFDTAPPEGRETVERGPNAKPPIPIGSMAPDFTVQSLSGQTVSLADLRGNVVLLDLWATWCGPCRRGLPDTARLAQEGAGHGLRVLAISNEPVATVAEFVREEGLATLPAYIDADGEVWTRYRPPAIPLTVIIDAEGKVAAYLVGLRPIHAIKDELRRAGVTLK